MSTFKQGRKNPTIAWYYWHEDYKDDNNGDLDLVTVPKDANLATSTNNKIKTRKEKDANISTGTNNESKTGQENETLVHDNNYYRVFSDYKDDVPFGVSEDDYINNGRTSSDINNHRYTEQ